LTHALYLRNDYTSGFRSHLALTDLWLVPYLCMLHKWFGW